jgi:hypothetical protein
MSGSAIRYGKTLGLAATAVLALSTVAAGGAQAAAPATASSCTITGITPSKIPVGSSDVNRAFAVKTKGCTVATWSIDFGDGIVLDQDGDVLTLLAHNLTNAVAGQPFGATAKVQSTDSSEDPATKNVTFTIQRRATWDSSFNATPEPVKKNAKLTIKATLKRISWNGKKKLPYVAYDARPVDIQFQASGSTTWKTIKTVKTSKTGKVSTTVKALKTGTWRIHFAGNASTSLADSKTDKVVVK